MPESPAVSVLTTVHNGRELLPLTVASVLAQSLRDFEYVIVDDGSTDGTTAYLRSLDDPRIRVLEPGRIGRGSALNLGLQACRADCVAVLDADDLAAPCRLEVQTQALARHPEIDVLGSDFVLSPDGLPIEAPTDPPARVIEPRELIRRGPISHTSVLMRRGVILAAGGYDAGRANLYDLDLWVRLASNGAVLARLQVPLVFKRLHAGQSFERPRRLRYVLGTARLRLSAFRRFSRSPLDLVWIAAGLAYGLLPGPIRRRLNRKESR